MDFWRTARQVNLISVALYWGPECKATIVRRYYTSIVLPLVRQSSLVRVAFLNWKIHKECPRRVSEGRKFSFRSRQPVATDFGYREENENLYTAPITWTSCFHPFLAFIRYQASRHQSKFFGVLKSPTFFLLYVSCFTVQSNSKWKADINIYSYNHSSFAKPPARN